MIVDRKYCIVLKIKNNYYKEWERLILDSRYFSPLKLIKKVTTQTVYYL